MRRIALQLGVTLMLVFGFSILGANSAQAYVCDDSPGATADDGGECSIHPDDMQSMLLDQERRIEDLESNVRGLQVGVVSIGAATILALVLSGFRKTQGRSDTKPRELQRN